MMASWFTNRLMEKCACGSGRSYRGCCLRRELAFAGIGVIAAAALFAGFSGLNRWTFAMTVCGVLAAAGLAGWWVQRRLK